MKQKNTSKKNPIKQETIVVKHCTEGGMDEKQICFQYGGYVAYVDIQPKSDEPEDFIGVRIYMRHTDSKDDGFMVYMTYKDGKHRLSLDHGGIGRETPQRTWAEWFKVEQLVNSIKTLRSFLY
jgi:hypothetical protein